MCPLDYYVIEGEGSFAVGKRRATLGPGGGGVAPAGTKPPVQTIRRTAQSTVVSQTRRHECRP